MSSSAWIEIECSTNQIRFFASRNAIPSYNSDTDFTADAYDFSAMVNGQNKYYLSLKFTEEDLQEGWKWYLLATFKNNKTDSTEETYSAVFRNGCKHKRSK